MDLNDADLVAWIFKTLNMTPSKYNFQEAVEEQLEGSMLGLMKAGYTPTTCKNLSVERYLGKNHDAPKQVARFQEALKPLYIACHFDGEILKDYMSNRATHFFMAFDAGDRCVAAASCELLTDPNTFYVRFLCSAKACKGAGSYLMTAIETFARDTLTVPSISLYSTPKAAEFYRKIGMVPAKINNNTYMYVQNTDPDAHARRRAKGGTFMKSLPKGRQNASNNNPRAQKRQK